MEILKKLPRELQIVLGGTVLYLIMSFLNWQQVSLGSFGSVGVNEWHGVGIIAGLLAVALLLWEASRVLGMKIEVPSLTPGLISVGLAVLLLLFTVITFLSHSAYRHWPEYLGLVLSIVIAVAAFRRARTEGVQMPDIAAMTSAARSSGSTTSDSSSSAPDSGPGGRSDE